MLYKQTRTTSNFFRISAVIVVAAAISFPLWDSALDDVIAKNEANVAAGGMLDSRTNKWALRFEEFKSSPLVGIGFAAVDLRNSRAMDDVDLIQGTVETGSSWLCILSMTGLIGALFLFPVFFHAFKIVWTRETESGPIILGVLSLFFIHMLAEGYAVAGASFLAFVLWLTVGLAYDQKEEYSE
jgi:hypothetical protein